CAREGYYYWYFDVW
nr:immunoglobulin heavy chain junction region [Mus musculus]MBK4197829.1 immunoglobulin heavy chain junction region [Mus musculus]